MKKELPLTVRQIVGCTRIRRYELHAERRTPLYGLAVYQPSDLTATSERFKTLIRSLASGLACRADVCQKLRGRN